MRSLVNRSTSCGPSATPAVNPPMAPGPTASFSPATAHGTSATGSSAGCHLPAACSPDRNTPRPCGPLCRRSLPGSYRFIVRADTFNLLYEDVGDANNDTPSIDSVQVTADSPASLEFR